MNSQQITLNQNKLLIRGELTFATVKSVWDSSQAIFPNAQEWNCDFSQVSNCDSAALALLVEWIKLAKEQGKRLRFNQLPKQLEAIASAAGLAGLLQEYR